MPRKPLSSNDIEKFRASYCETTYRIYKQEGYEAVTMRGVAKSMGCSSMTAYRYFDSKEDVFATLRAAMFHQLAQALEAVPNTMSPLSYLRGLGEAYVDYAQKDPDAYRLLYMVQTDQSGNYPEVAQAQKKTRDLLLNATHRAIESGDIHGNPVFVAHTLWASIHGLVSLDLVNQLTQGAEFNELFPAMMDSILRAD